MTPNACVSAVNGIQSLLPNTAATPMPGVPSRKPEPGTAGMFGGRNTYKLMKRCEYPYCTYMDHSPGRGHGAAPQYVGRYVDSQTQ